MIKVLLERCSIEFLLKQCSINSLLEHYSNSELTEQNIIYNPATGSAHDRPSARPPIDTRGDFLAHVYSKSKSLYFCELGGHAKCRKLELLGFMYFWLNVTNYKIYLSKTIFVSIVMMGGFPLLISDIQVKITPQDQDTK